MASDHRKLIGSLTRRNLVAATTVVVAALTSRAAHAGQYDHEADRGFGGHGHGHCPIVYSLRTYSTSAGASCAVGRQALCGAAYAAQL
jgi:hypothetical protein